MKKPSGDCDPQNCRFLSLVVVERVLIIFFESLRGTNFPLSDNFDFPMRLAFPCPRNALCPHKMMGLRNEGVFMPEGNIFTFSRDAKYPQAIFCLKGCLGRSADTQTPTHLRSRHALRHAATSFGISLYMLRPSRPFTGVSGPSRPENPQNYPRQGFCRNARGFSLNKVPGEFCVEFFGRFFQAFFLGK